MRWAVCVLGTVMLLAVASPLQAGWVWTKETGWYNPAKAVQSSSEELSREAGKAFEAKHYADAAKGYLLLIQTYPDSPETAQAYGQLLESQFLARDFDGALETSEEILKRKPDAETISHVVRRKYEIGAAFLTGSPRYLLGIPFSAENYGVEILTDLVEQYPYQPYADDSVFHIASYYFRRKEYLKSEVVYHRLIRDYPQSDWAGIAEYQIGEAALRRLKGIEYDFAPVAEADRRFKRYLRLHPGGDKAKEARQSLELISRLRSERLLRTAEFYRRERKPKAVRHYLQKILKDHPDTAAARRARELLKKSASDAT